MAAPKTPSLEYTLVVFPIFPKWGLPADSFCMQSFCNLFPV